MLSSLLFKFIKCVGKVFKAFPYVFCFSVILQENLRDTDKECVSYRLQSENTKQLRDKPIYL